MDIEKLKQLINEGKDRFEIASILNCHEGTVRRKAKELGLKIKTKIISRNDPIILNKIEELLNQNKTNKEIANILDISPTTARRYTKELLKRDTNSIKNKSISDLDLTQEQLEILYGSLLGDMSITKTKNLARIVINQGGSHEQYFDYVCSKFKNIIGKISKSLRFDKRTEKYYNKFTCKALAHSKYLELYNQLYINGVKTITLNWLNNLTARSIAYWFMDDGSVRGIFATNCFSLPELELCQKWFMDKFKIKTRIKKVINKEQYLLIVENESLLDFEELIYPYMHPSMYYKLVKIKS